ncbi:MAG TPA: MBL fold metallo-hydrolase [Gaiellaceae bacterium]|nr:MBL fold metallo-hydrolase [Gaiellaceae bacterium]
MAPVVGSVFDEVAPEVFRLRDTCNVYLLRDGRDAVLVDFGGGRVLDALGELGVDRVTDVLVTHHHRDQVQGLRRAVEAGARVWVPPVEVDLIAAVDEHWQARGLDVDYDLRQDRFSLLEQVPVAGTVDEYRTRRYGSLEAFALPTPGHTIGSVTYLVERGGERLAFGGDLVFGSGKVWSLAATQWSYGGMEGAAMTHVSCGVLASRAPTRLLPSHGEPIEEPVPALELARDRLQELVDLRREQPWDLRDWLARPFDPVTPHLLRNRTCMAHSYVLLSDSGAALLIDFGYDLCTGTPAVTERASRRPLLASLDALRRDYGVERVEVVLPTHYHDDHVAGIELLRAVERTEVWAPANVAPILVDPKRYDLPCLWFDPIAVDRTLPFGEPVRWREYELTLHPLPGHTLYAAAISFEVDGKRVLATGDQEAREGERDVANYYYRNRYRIDDYVRSAELYRELRPDVIVSGHWYPREVDDAYFDGLLADARRLAELHRELLPLDEVDFGAEGAGAWIEPYRSRAAVGGEVALDVRVRNPFGRPQTAWVELVVPESWVAPAAQAVELAPHEEATARFLATAGAPARRARVAADVTVGGTRFGQLAEALVDVVDRKLLRDGVAKQFPEGEP